MNQNLRLSGQAFYMHLDNLRRLYETIGHETLDQAGMLYNVLA